MPHFLGAALKALKHTDNGEELTGWERNFKPLNHLIVKFSVKCLSRQRRNHLNFLKSSTLSSQFTYSHNLTSNSSTCPGWMNKECTNLCRVAVWVEQALFWIIFA